MVRAVIRDTDNIIRNCTIERNGRFGIIFRKEFDEFFSGHRNLIENCIIRDNTFVNCPVKIENLRTK